MAEQAPRKVSADEPFDQLIHSRIMASVGWKSIRCPSGDDQISLGVELVTPKPGHPERFFLEIRAKVMMEPSREAKDSRRAPSERDNSRALVRRAMNPADKDVAVENEPFRAALDFIKLGWSVRGRSLGGLDTRELGFQQAGIAVQPQRCRFVESRLNLKRSRSF